MLTGKYYLLKSSITKVFKITNSNSKKYSENWYAMAMMKGEESLRCKFLRQMLYIFLLQALYIPSNIIHFTHSYTLHPSEKRCTFSWTIKEGAPEKKLWMNSVSSNFTGSRPYPDFTRTELLHKYFSSSLLYSDNLQIPFSFLFCFLNRLFFIFNSWFFNLNAFWSCKSEWTT